MTEETPYWMIELPPCPACGEKLELAQGRHTKKFFPLHARPQVPYHYFEASSTVSGAIASAAHPISINITGIVPEVQKKTNKNKRGKREQTDESAAQS